MDLSSKLFSQPSIQAPPRRTTMADTSRPPNGLTRHHPPNEKPKLSRSVASPDLDISSTIISGSERKLMLAIDELPDPLLVVRQMTRRF